MRRRAVSPVGCVLVVRAIRMRRSLSTENLRPRETLFIASRASSVRSLLGDGDSLCGRRFAAEGEVSEQS
jgi:hypothetical protein